MPQLSQSSQWTDFSTYFFRVGKFFWWKFFYEQVSDKTLPSGIVFLQTIQRCDLHLYITYFLQLDQSLIEIFSHLHILHFLLNCFSHTHFLCHFPSIHHDAYFLLILSFFLPGPYLHFRADDAFDCFLSSFLIVSSLVSSYIFLSSRSSYIFLSSSPLVLFLTVLFHLSLLFFLKFRIQVFFEICFLKLELKRKNLEPGDKIRVERRSSDRTDEVLTEMTKKKSFSCGKSRVLYVSVADALTWNTCRGWKAYHLYITYRRILNANLEQGEGMKE